MHESEHIELVNKRAVIEGIPYVLYLLIKTEDIKHNYDILDTIISNAI